MHHPSVPRRRGVPALALALALAGPGVALAQDPELPGRDALRRQVEKARALRIELLHQGARRRFDKAAREAREAAANVPAPSRRGRRNRAAKAIGATPGVRVTERVNEEPTPATIAGRAASPFALQRATAAPANVRVNDPSGDAAGVGQAEESIASLGTRVLVAWNDGQGFVTGTDTQGFGYSTDGGASFVDGGAVPRPPSSPSWRWVSDPVCAVDARTGRFFYCGLGEPNGTSNAIGVAYGHFAGASFVWDDTTVVVRREANLAAFLDKQWIAVDTSGAGSKVMITVTAFLPGGANQIDYQRSSDDGRTWTAPATLSDPAESGLVQGSRPAAGPNGEVYVTWSSIGPADWDFYYVRRSPDGSAASFGPRALAVTETPNFGTGGPGYNRERGITFPAIAVDRSSGVHRGRVYLAWNEAYDFLNDLFSLNSGKAEVEPNGFAQSATSFTIGQTLRGVTASANPNDLDWWKFFLSAGQHIVVRADSLAANVTYALRVFAPAPDSLQRLAFGGDITPGASVIGAWYTFTAPVTGTYFLRMGAANPGGTPSVVGPYRIATRLGVRGTERGRDQRDVFVTWSDDGVSWASPVRVNDSPPGFDESLPEIVVAADGCPYVTWRDHRDDPFGSRGTQYVSRSVDGGATWAANAPLGDALGNFTSAASNIAPNHGDYNALCADAGAVRAAWADGRDVTVDVWSARLDVGHVIAGCAPSQSVAPGEPAVRLAPTVLNLDPLWATEFTLSATSRRAWPMPGAATATVAAGASGPVSLAIAVPDTAAPGPNLITLTVAGPNGAIRRTCSVTLTVDPSLLAVGEGGDLALALRPVAPNPARGAARLDFTLPRSGATTLAVYGLRGERVRTLVSGFAAAGRHSATWDGRDEAGRAVSAGSYFARLESGGRFRTRRFVWRP